MWDRRRSEERRVGSDCDWSSDVCSSDLPAAFYTALLNNQPMGFYHPASLVKDAQRRGVRFHPIDLQQSDWLCRVEDDGAIRIGFMYVNGLRKDVGQAKIGRASCRERL